MGAVVTLKPYRVQEVGQPTWIEAQWEIVCDAVKYLSAEIDLTPQDLAELREGLHAVSAGRTSDFFMTSLDHDFAFQLWGGDEEGPGIIIAAIWVGELVEVMKGYRFYVTADDCIRFASELLSDEETLLPAGSAG